MALLFILFGLSKFYPFMPTPEVAPAASSFLAALIATGYVWPFVGLVEVLGGTMLLSGRTRLLGALLLLPVIAHIVPYLWILAQTVPGIPMGLFLISVEGMILWRNRRRMLEFLVPTEVSG
ncbi:MAG: DoxX family protein [Leptospiraceae bacterium]|nr:DoxX family protein [Leptospiraceae bacterium]